MSRKLRAGRVDVPDDEIQILRRTRRGGGQALAEVTPIELADIAWRIDSPELHEIAVRLKTGIDRQGRAFQELSAEELTELCAPMDW